MELVGKDAIENISKLLGHQDPQKAEQGTIRAMYGLDPVRNCVDTASDTETAKQVTE